MTDLIGVREFKISDLDDLEWFVANNDFSFFNDTSWTNHTDFFYNWINSLKTSKLKKSSINYCVTYGDDFAGIIMFDSLKEFLGKGCEIGYIIDQEYRNKKIGQTSVQKGILKFFSETEMEYVLAKIKPQNIPSQKIAEKLGFKRSKIKDIYGNYNYELNKTSFYKHK